MLFQVGKGAVLILTDSQWNDLQSRDVVIHKKAVVVTVPDGSTVAERVEAYRRLKEISD